ncbi:trypsin-like serine peptidase [Mammaliicoccus sciuri]|uniref:trypsin-like serine peptidase n=1 Tax=Mammaliicoccus sciuri TaxID=1296 RepID=UPI001E3E039B|nr:serine protease [Mammaliicoccus sciuri]MCD8796576.1 S1 family peptidase [Mammaliicoccus sciuri]
MYSKKVVALILGLLLLLFAVNKADAVGNYYYNGMESWNADSAYKKALKISNKDIEMERYNYAYKNQYKAVGRVSNMDGWKGPGKDSMGTGFVVGNHTFVTNAHVVDRANGRQTDPKNIKFQLNRDGKKIPYQFQVQKIYKVPAYDIVVVETKENMVQKANVKPFKLATNQQIKSLKFNDNLYSLGYPVVNGDNTYAYWHKLKFLQESSNKAELMTKDIFRAGDSGSPMVNRNFEVYALRTYGYNLRGNSGYQYAKQEVAGGESIYGNPRAFILKHIR